MKITTRMYDSYANAHATVVDLLNAGIARDDISEIANRELIDAELLQPHEREAPIAATVAGVGGGAAIGGGFGLMAGLTMIAVPGLGPLVVIGWLASAAAGAIGGAMAGGLVGALVDAGVPEADATLYSEAASHGAMIISARHSADKADMVEGIMDWHGPVDAASKRAGALTEGTVPFLPTASKAYGGEGLRA